LEALMSTPALPFSDSDLAAIRAAVEEAEKLTSGEIVPLVVTESDDYASAVWKGATLGALAASLAAWALYHWGGFWGDQLFLWMVVPTVAGASLGFFLSGTVAPLKRLLAGPELIELRTRRRASLAFLEEEVFQTRDRTGILLFVSLFEHRAIVLGDSGIHRQVEEGEWDGVVRLVVDGVRSGRPGEGLVAAIRECGDLLKRHGVEIQPADVDELGNELRRRDS
jgi:putative membrane protein